MCWCEKGDCNVFKKFLLAGNVKGILERQLCDEVEIVMEFTYCDGMVSADGGCEADVSARTRYGGV